MYQGLTVSLGLLERQLPETGVIQQVCVVGEAAQGEPSPGRWWHVFAQLPLWQCPRLLQAFLLRILAPGA